MLRNCFSIMLLISSLQPSISSRLCLLMILATLIWNKWEKSTESWLILDNLAPVCGDLTTNGIHPLKESTSRLIISLRNLRPYSIKFHIDLMISSRWNSQKSVNFSFKSNMKSVTWSINSSTTLHSATTLVDIIHPTMRQHTTCHLFQKWILTGWTHSITNIIHGDIIKHHTMKPSMKLSQLLITRHTMTLCLSCSQNPYSKKWLSLSETCICSEWIKRYLRNE